MAVECIWNARAELGEGVLWHPGQQALYWVDIIRSELHRYEPNGETRTWSYPGSISSLVPYRDGGFLATFQSGVAHINPNTSKATHLVSLEEDLPTNRFNDGCCDTLGNYWFGSMDQRQRATSGYFYRLGEEGEVCRIPGIGPFCITNGPTFSRDGQHVFLTDTLGRRVYRGWLDREGNPLGFELFLETDPSLGHPDGMSMDCDGGLWVCFFGGGQVVRFKPDGEIDEQIDVPAPNVTKCAFGGPDFRTLYITTARVGMSGQELKSFELAGGLFSTRVSRKGFSYPPAVCPIR